MNMLEKFQSSDRSANLYMNSLITYIKHSYLINTFLIKKDDS